MNTIELINILSKDKFSKKLFCGVLPIDLLQNFKFCKPCSLIVNTEESTKPGEHWIAFFITNDRHLEYFDSYGIKPFRIEIYNFIKKHNLKLIYNKKKIQNSLSINCGKFCILYLLLRNRGFKMKKILKFFVNNKNNDLLINKIFLHEIHEIVSIKFKNYFLVII